MGEVGLYLKFEQQQKNNSNVKRERVNDMYSHRDAFLLDWVRFQVPRIVAVHAEDLEVFFRLCEGFV